MRYPRLAPLLLMSAGCASFGADLRPTLAARGFTIPVAARTAGERRPLPEGPRAGIALDASLGLVSALGDDAWTFGEPLVVASGDVGGLRPAWTSRYVYLVEPATGAAARAFRLPHARYERGDVVTAVAAAVGGERVAALFASGNVMVWSAPSWEPVELVLPPLTPGSQAAPSDAAPSTPSHDHTVGLEPYAPGRLPSPYEAATKARLFFSPDGERLVAGAEIFALSDGRALLELSADAVVLDASSEGAVVARLVIERREGPPGSQCGFTHPYELLRVGALAYRPVGGPAVAYAGPIPSLPARASATGRWVSFGQGPSAETHDLTSGAAVAVPVTLPEPRPSAPQPHGELIDAVDLADDGTLAYVAGGRAWVVREGAATELALPVSRPTRSTARSVALGRDGAFMVAHEDVGVRSAGALYAFDRNGAATGLVLGGHSARVSRSGHAVVGPVPFARWALGAEPERSGLDFVPQNLHATDQGRAVAGGSRVVMHDTVADGSETFTVLDEGQAPRTLTLPTRTGSLVAWDVADDGSSLAAVKGEGLVVVALDDGTRLAVMALDAPREVWALATSRHVTAVGDTSGAVRILRDGREARVDLSGRQDWATALAVRPDERELAIGTARGRLLRVALGR